MARKFGTKKRKDKTLIIDAYKHIFTHMQFPVSETFINRLAMDLANWAQNDEEALKLTQFLRKMGISKRCFYNWCNKYPILMEAKETALQAIGDRREIGAIKNKFNVTMIIRQQHHYDEDWWDSEVKRARLKAETDKDIIGSTKYTVVVDSYKDTEKGDENVE